MLTTHYDLPSSTIATIAVLASASPLEGVSFLPSFRAYITSTYTLVKQPNNGDLHVVLINL